MATSGIPASGIGSLSTLIKRLEAATSRLEDITLSQASASTLAQPTSEASESIAPHLAAATAAGAAGGATGAATAGVNVAPAAAPEDPPAVVAWDETVTEALKAFTELSSKLGGLVQEQVCPGRSNLRPFFRC